MTDIQKRIINLAQLLGIDTDAGSAQLAELKGYAAGLALIGDALGQIELQLSPFTASGSALSLLCNLFGIDVLSDDEERRRLVIEQYSLPFGSYEYGALAKALGKYGVSTVIKDRKVYLYFSQDSEGAVDQLGKILDNYLAPNTPVVIADGSGRDFDYWDNTPYSFDMYDRLGLPFYILDSLI